MTTPNTPANGGQILTDSTIIGKAAESGVFGTIPQVLAFARAIESDLRAALAAVPGKVEPEMWRVRYLCTAILNNCVVEETKRDARMVYDAIEGKSAAPVSAPQAQDLFDGDDAKLCDCIHALLALDQAGALVPHGIGGHARTLLATAALRLADAQPAAQGAVLAGFLTSPEGKEAMASFRKRDATPPTDKTAEKSDIQS